MKAWSIALIGDATGGVLRRLEESRGDATVVKTCHELSELLACVAGGIADAVIFVEPEEDLTYSMLAGLREERVAVVVMTDVPHRFEAFDPVMVPAAASVTVILDGLEEAGRLLDAWADRALEQKNFGLASCVSGGEDVRQGTGTVEIPRVEKEDTPAPSGKCWSIWGPLGGPGVSTIAVNISVELARVGLSVCLIDADTYGGIVQCSVRNS